jgi:Activator of Hsp90 ATPase homolog 1-like protein
LAGVIVVRVKGRLPMNDATSTKQNQDFTTTISIDQTPEEAFRAINDVRGWWSGDIEGPTDELGGEFTYRYAQLHFTKQKVTELLPGKRIVWLVVDSKLHFVENKTEWTGTRVIFDIARKGDKTEIRFTHEGLNPARECYAACSSGWTTYVRGSLPTFIATGKGRPGGKEKSQKHVEGAAAVRS